MLPRVTRFTLVALALMAMPATASAADRHATPSTFASTFSAAQGGDTIYLAAGNYGTWSGGSKSSTVTIAPETGAAVSMGLNFGASASNLRLQGLTIPGFTLNGVHDVTIADSAVTGPSTVLASLNNANIMFDRDTFDAIDACGSCYEGRLTVRGYNNTAPVGVAITNSHFGNGGCSDGVQIVGDAYGVQVGPGNEFSGIVQGSCAAHADSIQLYGSKYTRIIGNYFHGNDTIVMAPDGGDHETISDNVMVGSGYVPAVQLGSHTATSFVHNTVKDIEVTMDHKSGSPASTNGVIRDNVFVNGYTNATVAGNCTSCTVSYNLFSSSGDASGTNTVIGSPQFTGGSSPSSYSGYTLAAGSPGKANASDGSDRGINAAGGAPPPPPPPPPPDTTAPDTTITSGPSGMTTDSTPTFAFASSESGSTFQCRVDAGGWASCSSPWTTSVLSDGAHSVSVRATDAAGNTDASPATQNFTVATVAPPPPDTTAPNTTITSGPSGATSDNTPTFAFSSSESGSSFQCRVDAGSWASCASPWTTSALSDGAHSVSVRATDAAGNTDASPATQPLTVDTTAPATTITSAPAATTIGSSASVSFTSGDAGAHFQCRRDGGAWIACTSPWSITGLALGTHTADVRAIDAVGNIDASPATATWANVAVPSATPPAAAPPSTTTTAATPPPAATPATTEPAAATAPANEAPSVTLRSPGPGAMFSSKLSMSARASDDHGVTRVEFWVDGVRVALDTTTPYSATFTARRPLSFGSHTVTVRAFDAAGLASSAAATVARVHRSRTPTHAAAARAGWRVSTSDGRALLGRGGARRAVVVALTRCADRTGRQSASVRLRADDTGAVSAPLPADGLCVLRVRPVTGA